MMQNNRSSHISRRRFFQSIGYAGLGLGLTELTQWSHPSIAQNSQSNDRFMTSQSTIVPASTPQASTTQAPIKVGVIHSLTGSMAISEKSVMDATLMAIEEINASGGVLGRSIEAIVEDGETNWVVFAEKAGKLIQQDQVVTIFGGWTSASRKVMLPRIESLDHLLWYPIYYEGQECSRNVIYTGSIPNQQIEPSVEWLRSRYPNKPFFLIGSDYVYPRVCNLTIKEKLRQTRLVRGEDYIPLGDTNVIPVLKKIKRAMPKGGIIYNSLNGDSNIALFVAMRDYAMTPQQYPVLSVSISEEEVMEIGANYLKGHYAAWGYFQTVKTTENQRFVKNFKSKYGDRRLLNEPMEAAYTAVYLWKQAVEKAGTATDLDKVRSAAIGQSFNAPSGVVTIDRNHHVSRYCRIGQVRSDGLFNLVYESQKPIAPEAWSQTIPETRGYACDWTRPERGRKYKVSV